MNRRAKVFVLMAFATLADGVVVAHPGHGDEADDAIVDGTVVAREYAVTIQIKDGIRTIDSDGIPNHPTGQFPNRHNPNSISAQKYRFRMPVDPQANDQKTPVGHSLFGVAVNGIVFDPGTAEFWKNDPSLGWRMEAIGGPRNLGLDQNNAHVQPSGAYHYHAIPTGLLDKLSKDKKAKPIQLGWAADGFPIYGPMGYSDPKDAKSTLKKLQSSYRLKKGERPAEPDGPGGKYDGGYTRDFEYAAGSGDLDECNGRFGVTPEFPDGTYYYVITDQFPFIGRYFHGTPDPSFQHQGPGGGRGPGGGGGHGGGGGPGGGGGGHGQHPPGPPPGPPPEQDQ